MSTLSLSLLCLFFSVLPLITSIKHETGLARAPPTCFPRVCSSLTYPPKTVSYKYRSASEPAAVEAAKLRAEFLKVLHSRRSGQCNLLTALAMASLPKENIENFKDSMQEEKLYLITEGGEQGRLPVLIISKKEEDNKDRKRPAVVFLHSTNKSKEWLRPLLEALISSSKRGDTMPFIYDTVWDLKKLADYLTEREHIDPTRIGITGESLGGMHAWFAGFADTRYSVVAPIIGVQGFRWAIENDKWQARVDSIKPVFEEARIDLGKSVIDKEVVEKVWDRIAPGLASKFDSPYTQFQLLHREQKIPDVRFQFIAQPGIGHRVTPLMVKAASDWFDKYLK
ncbi:Peptidase S9, prolyl oligopeptidase, catalytic domain containing protein [Trema orientale]|uniref:Peptidase S9, prolyl oligopeptidase, catalytic domain containing protein n=1 Tax=Trema orientale TaxID=63057 RepID=A0A2P5G1M3_TREOI|nr:Peptidase S9, prolyl oligopeptidase, catalytic domain containing protein [Trema orientale]